ncbi:6615_t:CDS:2 [Paraglomus brasilianum]|uniref:6615_t:CDS:1 n=1 Tax=Paraglomus brasilianum TaxID=144538 RepID=A0A9N8W469_9GLOM|nr:6615_t:CDS:2 [Paraglomus brasilianum]
MKPVDDDFHWIGKIGQGGVGTFTSRNQYNRILKAYVRRTCFRLNGQQKANKKAPVFHVPNSKL